MEIFALRGHKVKVTEKTKNNGYTYDKEKVAELLELEKIYIVEKTSVSQSSTRVYLKEFKGVGFNSVCFESVTNQPKELNENHEDYPRYYK